VTVHDGVRRHLDGHHVGWEELQHDETFSTAEEASATGVDPSHVAKTLLLHLTSGHALAVIPGGRRAHNRKVQEATGDKHARLATENEMAEVFPDYAVGTLPPLPALLGLSAYLDPRVRAQDTIVFAAGTHSGSVRMKVADLVRTESFSDADLVIDRGDEV
jgi:Ala-tRNA(Pro) deacylase